MTRVGLTGGIASGKSTVSARLAELGAVVIDSDLLAREVVAAGTPGLAAVVAAFGPDILGADGALDRARLAGVVFADPEARAVLEGIVHPLVRRRAGEIATAAPGGSVVVHDIPLLVETGQQDDFDVVVVVDADPGDQLRRLTEQRGLDPAQAAARIAAQADRSRRRAVADHVIINDGSLVDLREATDRLWAVLTEG